MILVDTSVWIDHLRSKDEILVMLLERNQVLAHPFVSGELACGNLQNRAEILGLLKQLPQAPIASNDETLFFIEQNAFMGRGIGFIDAHLLSSTVLAGSTRFWTRDKRLAQITDYLNLAYNA